jgi:hypothetical protein
VACATWDEFRQEAVREGWFTANGPEAATLYLHMAGVLRKLRLTNCWRICKKPPAGKINSPPRSCISSTPKSCMNAPARSIRISNRSRNGWTGRKAGPAGEAERVAEAWHKIRPMDIEPILLLMEEKEKRNAFHTSLQYLAKAERIDSVHPAVRQARLRLLAASALRHLQQKKPNLAQEKLAEMETLPQSQQGDRPAFLAALRYMVARFAARRRCGGRASRGSGARARKQSGRGAADLRMWPEPASGARKSRRPSRRFGKSERAGLPEAVVRVVELAKDMQISQGIPADWLAETAKQFARGSQSLNVGQLQTLAETGLSAQAFRTGLRGFRGRAGARRYGRSEFSAIAGAGPCRTTERQGRCASRRQRKLARQQRQMDVVDKAVELSLPIPLSPISPSPWNRPPRWSGKRRRSGRSPRRTAPAPTIAICSGALVRLSQVPPRARRGRRSIRGSRRFEDDDLDLDALEDMPLPPDMPPEIGKMLLEEANEGRRARRVPSIPC